MGCGLRKMKPTSEEDSPGKIYSTLKRPQVETKVGVAYTYRYLDFLIGKDGQGGVGELYIAITLLFLLMTVIAEMMVGGEFGGGTGSGGGGGGLEKGGGMSTSSLSLQVEPQWLYHFTASADFQVERYKAELQERSAGTLRAGVAFRGEISPWMAGEPGFIPWPPQLERWN
ncbi:raftlin-like protein [Lates japonicus]|uniref:Raftlin-like protein n=1 Tax=Lates japonicus TaxID=270547 RepID=A0AAD3MFC1_LATJO|nr:raftlin-like protein [Lates japonicus]